MILVYGLGRSGLGVLRFLRKRGLPACFYDDRPKEMEVQEALNLGFTPDWNLEGDYPEVVAAPGVPLSHPPPRGPEGPRGPDPWGSRAGLPPLPRPHHRHHRHRRQNLHHPLHRPSP